MATIPILAQQEVTASATPVSIYTVPPGKYAVVNITVTTTSNNSDGSNCILYLSSTSTPTVSEVIDYMYLDGFGTGSDRVTTIERAGVVIPTGKQVVFNNQAYLSSVTVAVWGFEEDI